MVMNVGIKTVYRVNINNNVICVSQDISLLLMSVFSVINCVKLVKISLSALNVSTLRYPLKYVFFVTFTTNLSLMIIVRISVEME